MVKRKSRKVEVIYYEGAKKGIKKFNPWGMKEKTRTFSSPTKAKAFAKSIGKKKNVFVNSLAFVK
jgi:hypothetical protein